MYPVYCHMSSLSAKCGGGGWTLVMKLDGDEVKHLSKKSFNAIQKKFNSTDLNYLY